MSQTKKFVADRSVMIGGKHNFAGAELELDARQAKHLKAQGVELTSKSAKSKPPKGKPEDRAPEGSPAEP